MQPALVYAYLAMAKFVRSSEIELGARGRAQALTLRDLAQAHLEESWNMQWIDLGLAEAAMVLALFETSAHPQHDDTNADNALALLDKIIETLQLTGLDAREHDTLDHSSGVPTVAQGHPPLKRCECSAAPADGTSSWSFQPAWDPLWSAEEIRAEESRRLCWSALVLVANHTVARAAKQREPLCLFMIDSSNVRMHDGKNITKPHLTKKKIILVPAALSRGVPAARRILPDSRAVGERFGVGAVLPQHASMELHRALLGRTSLDGGPHPNRLRRIRGDTRGRGSIGCARLQQ